MSAIKLLLYSMPLICLTVSLAWLCELNYWLTRRCFLFSGGSRFTDWLRNGLRLFLRRNYFNWSRLNRRLFDRDRLGLLLNNRGSYRFGLLLLS